MDGCTRYQEKYDDSSVCVGQVLRPIMLRNPIPARLLKGKEMKILNLNDGNGLEIGTEDEDIDNFGVQKSVLIKNPAGDTINGFPAVLATGYSYNLHIMYAIDWDHFMAIPPYHGEETDKAMVLRFNYTEIRELFEIK